MGLNRTKLSESRIETATPSGPEQRHARALVLFDKVLEKLEAEAASSVRGLLFVPGGLQTLGITDHEAAEILDFLSAYGILSDENTIEAGDMETIFKKEKDSFIVWMEHYPSTGASPVAATVDDTASAPDALSSGEPDAAVTTGLDASMEGIKPLTLDDMQQFLLNHENNSEFNATNLGSELAISDTQAQRLKREMDRLNLYNPEGELWPEIKNHGIGPTTPTDTLADFEQFLSTLREIPDEKEPAMLFAVDTMPQPEFAETPLGKTYLQHSKELEKNSPYAFEQTKSILNWILKTRQYLSKDQLSFFLTLYKTSSEDNQKIIDRLKYRGVVLQDPKDEDQLSLPPGLSEEKARAKIYLAIHNLEDPDDPSATPKQLILRSVPSITTATTPASSPAAPDAAPKITVESISDLIGSSSKKEARTILDKYFREEIADSIINKIFLYTDLWGFDDELFVNSDTLSKNFAGLDDFRKENLISALSAIQDKVNQPPISLDISAASATAPSVVTTFTVPEPSPAAPDNFELSDENIEDLVKHFDTDSWSLSYMENHLRVYAPGISEGYIRDFLKRAMAEHLIETGIDNLNQSFYRFIYNPNDTGGEHQFIQRLKNVLRSPTEPVLAQSPGNNPDTTPDRRQQRTTSVTRLFSAVKGLAQKSPKITGAIACFVILGVGSAMYSGKEKASESGPAAGAPAGKAPEAAAPQGQSREAAKKQVEAYKKANLYQALEEGPKNTVDRLMISTAEEFMMPYLNTVTIYQNSTPTIIRLNDASKKALFREMNIDGWKQLVKESYLQGPNNQQGAGDISLTDTDGKTYTNVYVRIDEQVARAFRDIRQVTMIVLKTDKNAPYPEGKIGDIYDEIKKGVASKLK